MMRDWVDKLFGGRNLTRSLPSTAPPLQSAYGYLRELLPDHKADLAEPEPSTEELVRRQREALERSKQKIQERKERETTYRRHQKSGFLFVLLSQLSIYGPSTGGDGISWRPNEAFRHLEIAKSRMLLAGEKQAELWDIACVEQPEPQWQPRLLAKVDIDGENDRALAFDQQGHRFLLRQPDSIACFDSRANLQFTLPSGAWFDFLPDGRIFLAHGGVTRIFSPEGQEMVPWPVHLGPSSVSPDGLWAIDSRRLLHTERGKVSKWDLGRWEKAAFSPDSRWLALVHSGGLSRLVNLANQAVIKVAEAETAPADQILTALWLDTTTVLTGRGDGLQQIWRIAPDRLLSIAEFPLPSVRGTMGCYLLNRSRPGELRLSSSDQRDHSVLKIPQWTKEV